LIERFLKETCSTWDSYTYWPKFKFEGRRNGELFSVQNSQYDFLTTILYGLNNKFNWLHHGQQFHKDILFYFYDYLCSKHLNEPKLLIAWSQTSLATLRKNRKLGGNNLLEHPMPHVDYWMQVNNSFYENSKYFMKPGFSRFSERMIRRMKSEYQLADFIQVHSSFAKQTFLDNGIQPKKLIMTPLGIRPSEFPHLEAPLSKSKIFKILYIGRLELWKGVHLLIDAVEKINSKNVELYLAGRVLPEIKSFLKSVKTSIKVLGQLNKEEVSLMIKESDIVVLPSLNDAFGMVILEAMAHGVPVIGSSASAAPDIIVEKENGLVVKAGSVENLVEAVEWCLENRDKLRDIGVNAKKTVLTNYLESHYIKRLEENLRTIKYL
jgi:glycosyltransferase involved in cell wall biosynthesis